MSAKWESFFYHFFRKDGQKKLFQKSPGRITGEHFSRLTVIHTTFGTSQKCRAGGGETMEQMYHVFVGSKRSHDPSPSSWAILHQQAASIALGSFHLSCWGNLFPPALLILIWLVCGSSAKLSLKRSYLRQFWDLRKEWTFIFTDSFLTMALLLFSLHFCVTVCLCVFHRELGGETMLRETFRGALSAQWERYCLSDRGLCHHAAGMRHAGGGQNQQMHHIRLLPRDKRRGNHSQRNLGARLLTWSKVWMNFSLK